MKYIKKFKHEEDFNAFKDSDKYVTPNVSYIHGVEKSKLRRNVKFKIKDTECNMGEGMTWEEWSKQKNHKHFGNEGFTTTDGKVSNISRLYVYKNLPTYEIKDNNIIAQHVYDLYDDPDKIIFYTNPNDVKANFTKTSIGNAKVIRHEYENGLGRIICDSKILSIPGYTFRYTSEFKSIRIPDSVTEIDERAFESCYELTDIYIGKNVRRFNDYAFYQDTKLERVHISSLENWCSAYFARDIAQPLNYAKQLYVNGKLVTNLQIPDGVTSISNYAFYRCESITNIKLPKTVTTIGSNTFRYCLGLTEIDIPNHVTTIGSSCFADCTNIEKIVLSNSIEVLESGVFYNCSNLRQLHLGKNIKSIKSQAFTNNPKLQDVYISDINSFVQIDCDNNSNPLSYTQNLYINGTLTSNIVLDEGVEKIGNGIFYNCKWLQSINLPDTLTSIGDYAFYNCTNLAGSWDIPTNVVNIGQYAFYNCTALVGQLIMPNRITTIGEKTFYGCTGIVGTIYLPLSLSTIGASAFYSCINISGGLVIPEGVTHIAASAFQDCKQISSVIIPSTMKSIGAVAWGGCRQLKDVYISDLTAWCNIDFGYNSSYSPTSSNPLTWGGNLYLNGELVHDLIIPDEVVEIKQYVFYNCTNLTSIQLPDHIEKIGREAFANCVNLSHINLPQNLKIISENAFYACSALTGDLIIPDGVTEIGGRAFMSCNFSTITIPEKIETIGLEAFVNGKKLEAIYGPYTTPDNRCLIKDGRLLEFAGYGLTEYTLPNTITHINDYYVSHYNDTLTTLILPETVTYIGYTAFRYCTKLTSLTIPDSVTEFGWGAFYNCSSLTSVYVTSPQPASIPSDGALFASKTKIYTYDNLVDAYKTKWNRLASKIYGNGQTLTDTTIITYTSTDGQTITPTDCAILSNTYENGVGTLTIIGNIKIMPSFRNSSTLQTITIPESIQSVGNYVFSNCSELISVDFAGNNVTTIGYQTFYKCSKLTNITLPDSVITIGDSSFWGSGLTSITIPNNVKTIAYSAFRECSNLTNIEIGNNVTTIAACAFYMSSQIVGDLIIPDSVTSIGGSAFWACKFTSVKFGTGLRTVGLNAFANCSNITKVEINDIAAWCQIDFEGNSYDGYSANPLITAKNLYLNGELLGELVIPEGVTEIKNNLFYGCTSITSLTLPSTLNKIGNYAFASCTSLTGQIIIPESVLTIGSYVFNKCPNIASFSGKFASDDNRCLIKDGKSNATGGNDIMLPMSINNRNYSIQPYNTNTEKTLIAFAPYGITEYVIPDGVTHINGGVFRDCRTIKKITIPDSVKKIETYAFYYCTSLSTVIIGSGIEYIDQYAFWSTYMKSLTITAPKAPTVNNCFTSYIGSNGTLYCPYDESYDAWIDGPLASFNWKIERPFEPQTYYNLSITADDARTGRQTTTTVYWSCLSDGIDLSGSLVTGVTLTGTGISNEFPQNLSETDTVEREITFEYQGLTATTTITQGVWIPEAFTVILNDNWEKSTTIANPDEGLYDGVYQSFSNKGVDSTAATMYIDIVGYEAFKFYIRSYAESNYDYVMVSQLDKDINNNTSYSDTSLVKAHTRSKQQSGTAISNYTLVEFTGLDVGAHRITVVYRKDGSSASGDDRGYVLIPFEQ